MNRAIFQYSFFNKFTGYIDWAVLVAIVLGPSLILAVALANTENNPDTRLGAARYLFATFSKSWFWMLIAYLFISDAMVSRRPVGDAAPLSLVFTRPMTRLSYVLSKWAAGAMGVCIITLPSALLFQLVCFLFGIQNVFVDGYMIGELAANSISYSALMVLHHCLPPGVGPITYFTMIGITNLGNTFAAFNHKDTPMYAQVLREVFVFLSFWLGDFTYPTIDVYTVMTSVVLDWHPIVVYLSNIVLFLVLAAQCLVHREFFYAQD